jgi:hypothetical protein
MSKGAFDRIAKFQHTKYVPRQAIVSTAGSAQGHQLELRLARSSCKYVTRIWVSRCTAAAVVDEQSRAGVGGPDEHT